MYTSCVRDHQRLSTGLGSACYSLNTHWLKSIYALLLGTFRIPTETNEIGIHKKIRSTPSISWVGSATHGCSETADLDSPIIAHRGTQWHADINVH